MRTLILTLTLALILVQGCKSPTDYRRQADDVAYDIIRDKQVAALGYSDDFTIAQPSDILRHRLMLDQKLQISSDASLGIDNMPPIEHWPDPNYIEPTASGDKIVTVPQTKPLKLSLVQALQIGAANSFTYQSNKEQIFRTALSLDLERNDFRTIFDQQIESFVSSDTTGDRAQSGYENSAITDVSKQLKNGTNLAGQFAIDLANLLTMGGASSLGLKADATISVPLMRGSGEHIVTEPLTQAERNVLYAIYDFERFKRTFAVNVATEYYNVLRQLDQIANNEANYKSLIMSVRRARRRADVGELSEIEVDQAVQDELRARERWIIAQQSYKRGIDDFKILLGLPTDAIIELEPSELEELTASSKTITDTDQLQKEEDTEEKEVSADDPVELIPASYENAGPYEIPLTEAIDLGLNNRLDLRITKDQVFDSQRKVVVFADNLRGELTLFGSASAGQRRSIGSATSDDAQLRLDKATYSALLNLDLPIERTAERNAYRNSLINLEAAIREFNTLEDQVKLDIRNRLRTLLTARESIMIQATAVTLAEKRVDSTNLFMETGRAQVRDILEAQDSLLSAQNSLTAAIISYRVAELQLQRDMGLLQVNSKGLFREFNPEVKINDKS